MIFKNITGIVINAYGYDFPPGVEVEVTEPTLVGKFQMYDTLENFIEGESTVEPTREELKAKADEMGIEYYPRIKTDALRKLVEG